MAADAEDRTLRTARWAPYLLALPALLCIYLFFLVPLVTLLKISLSERFGLWVAFYPFRQDDYLAVVAHWLGFFGADAKDVERARGDALRWALERGSRSGRVAWQFARDWAGHHVNPQAPPRS